MKQPSLIHSIKEPTEKHGLYIITYEDRITGTRFDSHITKEEYEIEMLKRKLFAEGALWNDIEELASLCWSNGYDEGEDNEAENNSMREPE